VLRPLREGLFPETPPRTLDLMNATLFATLSGMAEQQRYAAVGEELRAQQLSTLRENLVPLARRRPRVGRDSCARVRVSNMLLTARAWLREPRTGPGAPPGC